jgi:hypothetical protein
MSLSVKEEEKNNKKDTYSVYIHHHRKEGASGFEKWERRGKTANMNRALKQAKGLYKRGDYSKIEVKKQSFDNNTQSATDILFRTYSEDKNKKIVKSVIFVVALVLYGSALAAWSCQIKTRF